MRDIIITVKRQKQELLFLAVSFAAAFIMNIAGIIIYRSPAIELISSLHVVLLLTPVIYAILLVLRLLIGAVVWLSTGKRKS